MADFNPSQSGSSRGGLGIILGAVLVAVALLYLIFTAGGTPGEPNFVAPNADPTPTVVE